MEVQMNLLAIVVMAVALALLSLSNNATVAVASRPSGLAAPPFYDGRRMGTERLRSVFCNLLMAPANYMEAFLGKSRCTNPLSAFSLVYILFGTAIKAVYQTSRSLISQSGKPMSSTFVANAATRIISFVGQITSHMLPTGDKRSDWV